MLKRWILLVALAAPLATGCGEETPATEDDGSAASGAVGGAETGGAGGAGGSGGGELPVVEPTVILPETGIRADELVVIANAQDAQSVAVAAYYKTARGLPDANVITVDFAVPGNGVMTEAVFDTVYAQAVAQTPDSAQAYAIAWTTPYRVGCMSLTTAFAVGFDAAYCGGCAPTAFVPYFDSSSTKPWQDHGVRPTMMLAAASTADAEALIDRGVAADDTFPDGDGYLVRTTDEARSVRYPQFEKSVDVVWAHPEGLSMSYVDNADGSGLNYVEQTPDVLFYFTGLANVPEIDTNTYLPGAAADHLTSYGGQVPTSSQMSILRWLEAGATASYGTVVEPCNYPTKFPNVTVMVPQYYRGATLVEAYWKSVAWPGEGLFVGEPLARPWGRSDVTWSDGALSITTTMLQPGLSYEIVAAESADGPWTTVKDGIFLSTHQRTSIDYGPTTAPFYRLRRVGDE